MDIRLDIVFIPPKGVANYSINLCAQIEKQEQISFSLDGVNNFPHITIYQLVVPENNLERLIENLDQVTKNLNPQTFIVHSQNHKRQFVDEADSGSSRTSRRLEQEEITGVSPWSFIFSDFQEHFGFLGASFKNTEKIKKVQKEIVEQTTELREGRNIQEANDPTVASWPENHKKIIAEYGFDNLFDFYNPHITITQLPDFEKAKQLAENLTWPFTKFVSNSIGLYELGEFGTCNKLIKEFKLKVAD